MLPHEFSGIGLFRRIHIVGNVTAAYGFNPAAAVPLLVCGMVLQFQ
jgi:hypothetical protein